jgi:putative Mn2+ efflux pump MntP
LVGTESVFIAAALVGILHMSAPDHWATLVVLGKSAKWTFSRLTSVTLVSALGHVSLSVLIGFAIVALTSEFPKFLTGYFTQAIGIIMIITGLYVAANSLLTRNDQSKSDGKSSLAKPTGYFAVLGAALSPDLSILPILLVAAPLGLITMVRIMIIFAFSSIVTDLLLVIAFSILFRRAVEKLPSKYNDALVGLVVAAVGVYVLIFG